MKFGITVNTYFPCKDGVQFVTQSLAEGLVKKGHQVTVITNLYPDRGREEIINGVKVNRYDLRNKGMFFFGEKDLYQEAVIKLSQQVDKMIFVGIQRASTAWILPILKEISCEKYLYVHGRHEYKWKKTDYSNISMFLKKILRDVRWYFFYKKNEKYFECLDGTFQLHEEDYGYKYFETILPNKNYILMNFAEKNFFEVGKGECERDGLICVANYSSQKNQKLLLRAFYMMKNKSSLVMIGSTRNSYYEDLLELKQELEKQYGCKEVRLLYGVERNEIPNYLAKSKVFVLPSLLEKFPISIIEAMAVGLPFISLDTGIVKYLPGGVIISSEVNEMAKAMDELIDNETLYYQLKGAAKKYADDYLSFEKYIEKFMSIC